MATATPVLNDRSVDAFLVNEEKVIRAVQRIVAKAAPMRVTVFGSRARGTHHPESDLDLAVMLDRENIGEDRLRRSDLEGDMSIDLLVYDRARHEFMKESIVSVHFDIENEGVTLYDSAAGSIDYRAVQRIAG
jgi:predicted nucleotidyltransferase